MDLGATSNIAKKDEHTGLSELSVRLYLNLGSAIQRSSGLLHTRSPLRIPESVESEHNPS